VEDFDATTGRLAYARFDVTDGTNWPKAYFVTLVLAEVDMGGLPRYLNALLAKIKGEVDAAVASAIGAGIGISGGPVGIAIGIAVGYVVGRVFDWLSKWWADDIFRPSTVSVELASQNARWEGSREIPLYTLGSLCKIARGWPIWASARPNPPKNRLLDHK